MVESFIEHLISSVIAVGSLLFPFITGTNASFDDVNFYVNGNSMYFSGQLINCYTTEFDEILKSGQTITLNFKFELYKQNGKKPVFSHNIYRTLKYDLVDESFTLFLSENRLSLYLNSVEGMHEEFTKIRNYKVLNSVKIREGQRYFIRISAYLEKITFYDISEKFDLMLYWNNSVPVIESKMFDSSLFLF